MFVLSQHRRNFFFCICALLIAFFSVYAQTLHFPFVLFDDATLTTDNPLVTNSSNATAIAGVFSSYDPELYIPITLLSYRMNYLWSGMDASTYHLTNILLHLGTSLTIFFLLMLLRRRLSFSLFCALIFCVHPLASEAVSWISARKDLLAGFFALMSILFFVRFWQEHSRRWLVLSLCIFLLGLLSKVSIVLLPVFFCVLIDFLTITQHARDTQHPLASRHTWLSLAPFFALSFLLGLVALGGKSLLLPSLSPLTLLLLGTKAILVTLGRILFPLWFSVLYPQIDPITLFSAPFFISLLVTVCLIASLLWSRRRVPDLYLGLSFFLLMFSPSFFSPTKIGVIYVTADHYAYPAFFGIVFIFSSFLFTVFLPSAKKGWKRLPLQLCACLLIVGFGIRSYMQTRVWRDSISLFTNVLHYYPQSALAYNTIGSQIMLSKGDSAQALSFFRRATSLDPHYVLSFVNIATLLLSEHKESEAIAAYKDAIAAIPTDRPLHMEDIIPYSLLSQMLDDRGDTAEAIRLRQVATMRAPDIAEAWYNLGLILQKYERTDEAIVAFQRATKLDARFLDAHYRLAAVLSEKGRLQEALLELQKVAERDPQYEEVQKHLAALRALVGSEQ